MTPKQNKIEDLNYNHADCMFCMFYPENLDNILEKSGFTMQDLLDPSTTYAVKSKILNFILENEND